MKIIIPVMVGAIIGYFTNWLAIKMLFRPHNEKKILGIKIPFTPGLIPKERARIANSIGETVGVYLLSPETIIEAMSNKKTDKEIKLWLEDKVNKLKGNQQSVKEVLVKLLDDNYQKIVNSIEQGVKSIIISQIRGEHFKALISRSIENKVRNINSENIYELMDEKLKGFILELSNSPELKSGLINQFESKLNELTKEERRLSEIIPEEMLASINQYIDANGYEIGNTVKESFKDPFIQQKLKASISELVFQNIPKMIMAFISPDIIAEKIFHMIEKYINSEEANKGIVMLIKSSIDKLLDSKTSEVTLRLIDNINHEELEKASDILIKYISNEENYNMFLRLIQDKLRSSEENNKEKIIDYLNRNIDSILNSDELEESISVVIQNLINQFLNSAISSITEKTDEDILTTIYNLIKTLFEKFAIHELPHIIEFFDIAKIVEDKVNSFDVAFTEELILDIANKELKAITWLGALLGGILGILSPLLQMLY